MAQKLYVGNLPFSATEDEIRDLFSQHGEVAATFDAEPGGPASLLEHVA